MQVQRRSEGAINVVTCLVCDDAYYEEDGAYVKYTPGSDPACVKEDLTNMDRKCKLGGANPRMVCRSIRNFFAVSNDGIEVTCQKAQILSFFIFVFIGLIALALNL